MPFYENLKLYCVHFKLRIRNGIMLAIQKWLEGRVKMGVKERIATSTEVEIEELARKTVPETFLCLELDFVELKI